MSNNGDESNEPQYVSIDADGTTSIEQDGYIDSENIRAFTFTFAQPQEITEGVSDKNRGKQPVSFTKRGRSAYSPASVNYPDGTKSSTMVMTKCIIQHTEALKAANHKYAKNFVIIGIPESYIDKIIADAKLKSNINLAVKPNTGMLNGHYWLRCNLDKLRRSNTRILLNQGEGQTIEMELEQMLIEFGKSIEAFVTFTLSASINNNDMAAELDLRNGQYYITMKPTEVWAVSDTDIQGPVLQDTNNRKSESASVSGQFFASGALAEFAMRRLKVSSK